MSDSDGLTSAFQHKGAETGTTKHSHVGHKLFQESYPDPTYNGPEVHSHAGKDAGAPRRSQALPGLLTRPA